jgi:hypothetical protein
MSTDNKIKTKPCKHYFGKGFCKLGDACNFMHETMPALGESQQEMIINALEREQMMKTPPSSPKKAQSAPWAPKKAEIVVDRENHAHLAELNRTVREMLLKSIPENMSWGDYEYYNDLHKKMYGRCLPDNMSWEDFENYNKH